MSVLDKRVSLGWCTGLAVAAWLACPLGAGGQAGAPVPAASLPLETFDRMMTELSNWGRWGKDDQKGAVNLITPAKRKQALAAVKDGISVSMARTAETTTALDNARPVVVEMMGRGGGRGAAAAPGAAPAAPV